MTNKERLLIVAVFVIALVGGGILAMGVLGGGGDGGASPDPDAGRRGSRPVCFEADTGYVDTPVLWRPDLPAGHTVGGPVIIEEFGSTVPIHPGFTARVDDFLNIIVTKDAA